MNRKKSLLNGKNRRSFLKGLGTIAVGLPVFDFMLNSHGTAYANGLNLPKRFVTMYNGVGLGWSRSHGSMYVPDKIGANYDLKPGISKLGDYAGVKDYTSVVTNQLIPYKKWSDSQSQDPGPGGLCGMFHRCSGHVQLSGSRVEEIRTKVYKDKSKPTADYIYANSFNQKPFYFTISATSYSWHRYIPNLDLARLTSRFYGFDMQVDMSGAHLAPEHDPQRAYNKLVGISREIENPQNNLAKVEMLTKKKSILDFLDKRRVNYLKRELSSANKTKLNDHFDFIRQIEKGIQPGETSLPGLTCKIDAKNYSFGNINTTARWSDENKRADVWSDLLALAFQCDALRSGTLQITEGQSTIGMQNISGVNNTYHDTGHGPHNGPLGILKYSQGYNWHVGLFAQLAEKLKNTSEGGGNLLDNSALVLASEGGFGRTSDVANNPNAESTHSTENMVTLIAGRAGGLKGGVHVRTNQSHPSKVLISALNACSEGKINRLGEVSGRLDELFT